MATTSYLYHTLGLKNYRHLRTEYRHGTVLHHVRRKNTERFCRGCSARWHHLRKAGRFTRVFHALPIGKLRRSFFTGMNNTVGAVGMSCGNPSIWPNPKVAL